MEKNDEGGYESLYGLEIIKKVDIKIALVSDHPEVLWYFLKNFTVKLKIGLYFPYQF